MKGKEAESRIEDFGVWMELAWQRLAEQFVEAHPEDFPTSESMTEIDKSWAFQDYCDKEWNKYVDSFTCPSCKKVFNEPLVAHLCFRCDELLNEASMGNI